MFETATSKATLQAEDPFEPALEALLVERERAGNCGREDKALILGLIARVPAAKRGQYLARLHAISAKPDARGSDVYRKVVQFLDHYRRPEWTNGELKTQLAAAGVALGSKEVGNFAAYLVKCGRFERLARGHYRDRFGNVIVTATELPTWSGLEPSENER